MLAPVLSRMFRGKMLTMLGAAHDAGQLQFFGPHAGLADKAVFKAFLDPLYRPSLRLRRLTVRVGSGSLRKRAV